MGEWILQNLKLIISGILVIISVIVFILRKPSKVDIWHYIYQLLPESINEAEKSSLKGQDKLYLCLRILIDKLSAYDLKASRFDYLQILQAIESFLSTPQKKGDKDGK